MPFTTISFKTDSDVVKTEGRNRISRDEIVLPSGTLALKPGSLVSKVTTSGAYAAYTPTASDGSQTPIGVSLEAVDASAGAKRAVILARDAEIVLQAIEWPVGTNSTQKAAAIAALDARGIVARPGV